MKKMTKSFTDWMVEPAEWWEFWMPMSGAIGGIIGGGMVFAIAYFFSPVN